MASRLNHARNVVGQGLWTGGAMLFMAGLMLRGLWGRSGTLAPDTLHSVSNNSHGEITYWTAYQATACDLLLGWPFVIAAVGFILIPKTCSWNNGMSFAIHDPDRIAKWGWLVGLSLTALVIFVIGPPLVRALNAAGVVLG